MIVIVLYNFHKASFWVYVPRVRVRCVSKNMTQP